MPRGTPAAPKVKGRMSAYAFFVQTCRAEHQRKHPDEKVVFAEFSKKCAERWKVMTDKEKKRFRDMAENDKKRVEEQGGGPAKGRRKRKTKDPNAPKRNLSAFFWFCNDERSKVRAENPSWSVGDVAKELSKRWADVKPEEKSSYEDMAAKDKTRYEKEKKAYELKLKGLAAAEANNVAEDEELDEEEEGAVEAKEEEDGEMDDEDDEEDEDDD